MCLPGQNAFTRSKRSDSVTRITANGMLKFRVFFSRLKVLAGRAHGGRELEHGAAAEDAVDLADVAALAEALLLDIRPHRLGDGAAGRLAADARDLRERGRARHRLEEARALFLLRRGVLLARRLGGSSG